MPAVCGSVQVALGLPAGDAGGQEGDGGAVRHQDIEEGRGDPGRRCGVHPGGEAGAGPAGQAPVPDAAALLLPDGGKGPRELPPTTQGPRSPSQPSAWEEAGNRRSVGTSQPHVLLCRAARLPLADSGRPPL